jgi:hypothetical protein
MTSTYRVDVFSRGHLVAVHTIEASDGLAAINAVEARYGEPPQVEYKTIHHDDGSKETMLVVVGWHGYTFNARDLKKLPG